MEALSKEPGDAGQPPTLRSVHADESPGQVVESRLHDALLGQLESTIAFADACTFLTSHRVSEQAGELVSLAWSLYEETLSDLRRSRPSG